MLDNRREVILKLIVEDYIQSAEPVGSKQLGDRHNLDVSPATIRAAMSLLEQEGYLRQPHTSAGRIPTEKAYVYYLQHVVELTTPTSREFSKQIEEQDTVEHTLKALAHQLVDASGETAIVAFDPGWSYYTGVSNLFAKPDFGEMALLRSVSMWIDQFDAVLAALYDRIDNERVVYIGSQNPFGNQMATILVKYQLGNKQEGIVGLVGPLRMNYARNIALVEEARELMEQMYE